jgi:uncharacterized protein
MNKEQAWPVVHNAAQSRFEAVIDGLLCVAEYHTRGNVMVMTHTVVPQALEGRGIAGALVRVAIAHARQHGLRIEPQCSYVAAYMQRHPETHDLRA